MLLRFRTRNFRSIRDEVELSLAAANISDLAEAVIDSPFAERGVLRAAAIYGANASGKSNVLRALQFMRSAVARSQRLWSPEGVPQDPFLLDAESAKLPSFFEVSLVLDDVRYEYGFELDAKRVVREWLHAYPTPRRQVWFERTGDDFSFGKFLVGENAVIQGLTRPNSLFLSAAAQNNHDQLLRVYRWFSPQPSFEATNRTHLFQYTAALADDVRYKDVIADMIGAADLGIERFEIQPSDEEGTLKTTLSMNFSWRTERSRRVKFFHRTAAGESIQMPLATESDGTLAYFALLGPIAQVLLAGGLLAIDEITSSVHPLLARNIVGFFNSPETNQRGAQLIFTTHDATLLDSGLLRRDQVWFTEKDGAGATHLYPLTDFKPRRGENVRTGYLQGRYGGIPFLSLDEALEKVDDETAAK